MATASLACTYTHATGTLSGLQYTADKYSNFAFTLFKWNGSSWISQSTVNVTGSAGQYSVSYTFTNLQPNNYYDIVIVATYGGTGYTFTTPNAQCPAIPSATFYLYSSTSTSLTIYRASNAGIDSSLQTLIYLNGSWVSLANSGLPYTTNGNLVTINGLTPSTNYYLEVLTYVESWYSVAPSTSPYYNTYTTQAPPIPAVPSAPTLVSRGDGSLTLSWGSVQYATSYTLRYKNYSGIYYTVSTTNTSATISGLEYGVTYYVSVSATNGSGTSAYSIENLVSTSPKIPSIYLSAVSSTTMDIGFNMNGNWDYVTIEWKTGSGAWSTWNVLKPNTVTTIVGLTIGTTYEVRAKSKFTVNGTDLFSDYCSSLFVTTTNRPSNFYWTTTFTSGGAITTSGNSAYVCTAIEWNRFTVSINTFRAYKNMPDYSFITVTSGMDFTYSIFNQARNALYEIRAYFTGVYANGNNFPSTVSSGDDVYAWYFNNMRDALNSIA